MNSLRLTRFALTTMLTITLVACIGLASKVVAGEREVEYIDEVISSAMTAFDSDDYEGYLAGIDELQEIALDEDAQIECRLWADLSASGMLLFEESTHYPTLYFLNAYVEDAVGYLPTARNNCMLAI